VHGEDSIPKETIVRRAMRHALEAVYLRFSVGAEGFEPPASSL
jgi:hypothetical protein